jgi:hypothetical protein
MMLVEAVSWSWGWCIRWWMESSPVVEAFDVVEDGGACLVVAAEGGPVESVTALS